MSVIKNIIKSTPFYKAYIAKQKREFEAWKLAEEQRQFPLKVAFYQQFIKKDDLVFDIGANVGNRVEVFLALGAKVVAVEPQPTCAAILRQKFGNTIHIENVGLGSKPGELDMNIATDSTISTFSADFIAATGNERFKQHKWVDTIKVPITTFDALIEKYGVPVFAKIDVEGFETEVLKGLSQAIPALSFEYCVPELQANLDQCIKLLTALSSSATFNYAAVEDMTLVLPEWQAPTVFETTIHSKQFIDTLFGDVYFRRNK
jgi:FkbM family methyltransferase